MEREAVLLAVAAAVERFPECMSNLDSDYDMNEDEGHPMMRYSAADVAVEHILADTPAAAVD